MLCYVMFNMMLYEFYMFLCDFYMIWYMIYHEPLSTQMFSKNWPAQHLMFSRCSFL